MTLTADDGSAPVTQTTNAVGAAVFRDLPVGSYTVTAASTQAGATIRGELTGQLIAAGATSITVSLVPGP